MKRELKPFWKRFLLALDNLGNVILSLIPSLKRKGFGYEDEQISSVVGKNYIWRNDRSWFISGLYKFLDWIDPGHCRNSIELDEGFGPEDFGE